MQANTRRDTKPELQVRRLLHAAGLRYRVDFRAIPEHRWRVDIAFTRRRIAVFIDGCFWHGCPIHATYPKTNSDYWLPKLERNRARDLDATSALKAAGWRVLRFWEHQAPGEIADTIVHEVAVRLGTPDLGASQGTPG